MYNGSIKDRIVIDEYKSKMIIGNYILMQKKHYNWFRKLMYRIIFDIKIIDIEGYKETSKLMIDLIRIEELYKYLMKQFEEYKEVYIVGENNE